MNKRMYAFALLLYATVCCAQSNGTEVELNNYSTSYAAKDSKQPFVLTAIPYNGKYGVGMENTPLDLAITSSGFRYRAQTENYRELDTYDSSEVYFYTPNIFASNAPKYEYRVLKNGKEVLTDWSEIKSFTKDNLQIESFTKKFGSLGGYKTTWGNFITVELRKKGETKIISAALVYWKNIKPAIENIYTAGELNEFLKRLKHNWDNGLSAEAVRKWRARNPESERDSTGYLPKKLVLDASNTSLIFYLSGDIYQKDALEYELEKDGSIITGWKPNDLDNNIVWLNNLSPGDFVLRLRYSGQRHNVKEYHFEIKPAWHQTTFFKIISGSLIAVFFSFIVVLFALRRQKRKTAEAQSKKDKLALELKAIHSQLNPHFIFNALSSIQGLINNNNIAGANNYLSKFGSLMRASLTGSEKDITSLDKEITMLETYLSLEQLRFGFSYTVDVDKAINASSTDIPALLLQPLVENAVKHGVATLESQGEIKLNFSKQDNDMIVTITDNGGGIQSTESSSGYGLKLTADRIKLLNEVLDERVIIFSINPGGGNGTTAHLLFKNWWL